jgi:hypothetical protein
MPRRAPSRSSWSYPLEGMREEAHWKKVPEKVPALAVQHADSQVQQTRRGAPGVRQGANGDHDEDTGAAGHASGTRRRKRWR